VVFGLIILGLASTASAGVFPSFFFSSKVDLLEKVANDTNSQNMHLLDGSITINPKLLALENSDISIIGDALVADVGPLGTSGDIVEISGSDQISVYVVHDGDTLSAIADMFDVSVNTIVWANDLVRGQALREGQVLTILPISGVRHIVKKGDTIASIAKKYKGDATEIALFNDLQTSGALVVGSEVIIPNGEVVQAPVKKKTTIGKGGKGTTTYAGYYMRPVKGGRRTQGIHGHNGIDIAAPMGTNIYAAASGTVIISKSSGWNGGYGNYVVIKHSNGTQTLYAHLSDVSVSTGMQVGQGDVVGHMGNTGKSTGIHLHFEVRGATNPF
jgi:LysM repeat protein